jgi:hypothetical protein
MSCGASHDRQRRERLAGVGWPMCEYGPEITIDFEDGSSFNACLGVKMTLEAEWTRDEGGQPHVLKDYTTAAIPS